MRNLPTMILRLGRGVEISTHVPPTKAHVPWVTPCGLAGHTALGMEAPDFALVDAALPVPAGFRCPSSFL